MELPPELRLPPPRPAAAAGHFLKKTRKTARKMLLGGLALFPALVVLFWVQFGDLNATTMGISAGISGLVELMGAALLVNARASLTLFREGTAVVGTVRKATSAQSALILEVEFKGATGATQVGQVTVLSGSGGELKEGTEVPLLYAPSHSRRCAIYTPKLGMMAGVVKG